MIIIYVTLPDSKLWRKSRLFCTVKKND